VADKVEQQALDDGAKLMTDSLEALKKAVDSIFAGAEADVQKLLGDGLAVAEDLIENLFPASVRPFVAGVIGSASIPANVAIGAITPRIIAALKVGQANVDAVIGAGEKTIAKHENPPPATPPTT